jgi:protocadherin-15
LFSLLVIKIDLPSFSDVAQQTSPSELPIFGELADISLELLFVKTEPIFSLFGKTLKLLKPLDRDQDNLSHIVFQVSGKKH